MRDIDRSVGLCLQQGGAMGLPLVVIQSDVRLFVEKLAGRGGVNGLFIYICKGVHRWVGSAGDLSLVDTVATGELRFFAP